MLKVTLINSCQNACFNAVTKSRYVVIVNSVTATENTYDEAVIIHPTVTAKNRAEHSVTVYLPKIQFSTILQKFITKKYFLKLLGRAHQ